MRDPNALISTQELATALGQALLRIYDCTTYLEPTPMGSEDPYITVPGIRTFEEAHIPGANFRDRQGEFSDGATRLRFMMPVTGGLEAAFGRHGIGEGTRVVLYSIGSMMWATRFWWMLRALGFDAAAVLDGGFDKWQAEGRPTESGAPRGYPAARLTVRRQGRRVGGARPARYRDRQRARAPVPQGLGAQPLRPSRAHPGQRQRAGRDHGRRRQGFHHLGRRRTKIRRPGRDARSPGDLLLRRRHLGDRRSLPVAPARLRRPDALRRLDGRMGARSEPADRDRLTRVADAVGKIRDSKTLQIHRKFADAPTPSHAASCYPWG